MGFVVAIIGRFGVGKSLLCEHFVKNGMINININEAILSEIKDSASYSLCTACLKEKYEDITETVPCLSDNVLMEVLFRKIEKEKLKGHCHVIVLPSFLDLTNLIDAFDFIVAVDCSRVKQRKYLEGKQLPEIAIASLLDSSYNRYYYTKKATDIFLNTVSLEHLAWVANQIFKSYKAVNIYK